ncbi:MAG: long-chain-fatty-acid--CoA ligase [Deltaproteobacteria bacterium]|nr:MAG: long-chain-fatty-acid--CoA ligase [Deltaproteobacteria bacterium]
MRTNLGSFLSKRAKLSPRLEAIVEVERGRRFTYAELDARANRMAHVLLAKNVRPGDRVALLLMNGVEYLETYFALAKIGAVMVPLNWRLVPDELAFILEDSGSDLLIFDGEFDGAVSALEGRQLGVRSWIRVGSAAAGPANAESYDALTADAPSVPPAIAAGGDDILFIMYTSGTTGLPKGAVHTHATMAAASMTINMTCDIRYRDRYLQVLPLFHVGALTPATSCFHRGGTLVMMRSFDPNGVFEAIERESVNIGFAVPAMLQFMWAVPARDRHDLSSLRWLLSGAAPVPVALIEQYAGIGIEIHQVYGLTESCGPACLISPEEAIVKAGSTGPAFFHTEVRVVNASGDDVAPGEVGEVIIRGAHVMKEYWKRPDATAETIRDGWLYSGDLATVDKEGFVYIRDRRKDLIISGAENVYPAEIEGVLAGHPKLLEAAVIGVPSARWGESPAAIVVPKPGESVTADEVIAYCRGKLASYKIPKLVEFVEQVPRNPTGKILKRVLREQFPGPAPE